MHPQVNTISGRMSLRPPQRKSLEILDRVTEICRLGKDADTAHDLSVIQSEYPTVQDFERTFPSLCFALATGVGKTRLMGAFITYLHLVHRKSNYFVLAPNLTIYNKLISDFTPNNPKYVFKGIAQFAQEPPEIITGDNYESGRGVRGDRLFEASVHINIFNISKITSEMRGGRAPRIKRLHEYIGQSYFDYLAGLDDLVLIMDESHRYRASAGIQAINELKPILGLELTATPQVESSRGPIPFKNVIYSYKLADAMKDGFVKEPAVATRENFRPDDYSPEALETIKLEDGIRIHEETKVELELYAGQHDRPKTKPFMLVVARDVTHAEALVAKIQQEDFFDGRYKGKVITVHSSQTGEEKDDTVQNLLSVESPENPVEIVVHVNMLKEGWDVVNLYTIVPLRAADSRTLVEQSIGRGLRLPYGQRVGVPPVDRLTIVAHDRFKEIVDEANKPDSPINFRIQEVIVGRDVGLERRVTEEAPSCLEVAILGTPAPRTAAPTSAAAAPSPRFADPRDQAVAKETLRVIEEMSRRPQQAPTAESLRRPEIQREIARRVAESLPPRQANLPFSAEEAPASIESVVAQVAETVAEKTIGIPRIVVVPKGDVVIAYSPFTVDAASVTQHPVDQNILIQHLRTNERHVLTPGDDVIEEERLEDYIVRKLIDKNDILYDDHADLLYGLAGQVIARLKSYLPDDAAVRNVLLYNQGRYADLIHQQMQRHRHEKVGGYEAQASRGFEIPRSAPMARLANDHIHDVRDTPAILSEIPRMVFGGFRRCLYLMQKFSSDPERRFAVLLEDEPDDLKWFKPVRDQFRIYYRGGEAYEPDFVVETGDAKYLCEPKRDTEMDDPVVLAKARAAKEWCEHAAAYELDNGGKPWSYLLIPHDQITPTATLNGLAARFTFVG